MKSVLGFLSLSLSKGGRVATATVVVAPLLAAAASCSSAREERNSPDMTAPMAPDSISPSSGPQPDYGPLVQADTPPPPISGGSLAIDPTGKYAVAADADRDRVYVVDLPNRKLVHGVELPSRSEPGRVAIDSAGSAYVALRSGGGVAIIDLATGARTTKDICSAPRGVAVDNAKGIVYVACADGYLHSFDSKTRTTGTTKFVGRDLRDVVLLKNRVMATRFRSAEVIDLGADLNSDVPATTSSDGSNLAWRAVQAPGGGPSDPNEETTAVVEQAPSTEPVRTDPGGYGSGPPSECGTVGIVSTRLQLVGRGSTRLPAAVLPVDLATNGREYVVVAAGNAYTRSLPQLFIVAGEALTGDRDCVPTISGNVPGQAISAAFDPKDQLIIQSREPAALYIMSDDRRRPWKTITLATDSRADTGHAIFHSNAGGFIACASCHAEGGDDGRTWDFVNIGPRRTPSLLGTTAHTEPFHWDGDMKDLRMLVDKVLVERMSGPKVDDAQVGALGHYMFNLPSPVKLSPGSETSVRGEKLFVERCSTCHSGPLLTNSQSVDVGTGGVFQVPSLIGVAWRSPFIHTGCAPTLTDRFNPQCGGTNHGKTSDLKPAQIADLVGYLETL